LFSQQETGTKGDDFQMDRGKHDALPYDDLYIPLGWIDRYRAAVPIFSLPGPHDAK
jgi:hypothetical protein